MEDREGVCGPLGGSGSTEDSLFAEEPRGRLGTPGTSKYAVGAVVLSVASVTVSTEPAAKSGG